MRLKRFNERQTHGCNILALSHSTQNRLERGAGGLTSAFSPISQSFPNTVTTLAHLVQ